MISSSTTSARTGSAWWSTPARATRISRGSVAMRSRSASRCSSAPISPCSRCRARSARQGGAAARRRRRHRRARARRIRRARARRLVRGAHRLHRRGRLRDHDAGGRRRAGVARAEFARGCLLRSRRARHAASGGRHEPLRQRHGREHPSVRVGALAWTVALEPTASARSSAARRSRRSQSARLTAQARRTAARGSRRAARAPESHASQAVGEGEITSGTFSPTLERSIALRARAGGHRRHACRWTSAASC